MPQLASTNACDLSSAAASASGLPKDSGIPDHTAFLAGLETKHGIGLSSRAKSVMPANGLSLPRIDCGSPSLA